MKRGWLLLILAGMWIAPCAYASDGNIDASSDPEEEEGEGLVSDEAETEGAGAPSPEASAVEPMPKKTPEPERPALSSVPSKPVPKTLGSKRKREKEIEGTKAPNRFDAEGVIIKSHYRSKGAPLEVDTD